MLINLSEPAGSRAAVCDRAFDLLDEVHDLFLAEAYSRGMYRLDTGLHRLKRRLSSAEWGLFTSTFLHHPIRRIVHQDPFTSWSFKKPRGYAGDAQLLDFIYGHESIAPLLIGASGPGRAIYQFSSRTAAPCAVRERCEGLGALADQISRDRLRRIKVLAIAAGHLREADKSSALANDRIECWTALDQDEETIAYLLRRRTSKRIQPVLGSVRGLLSGRYDLGKYDLIYAAGLYDYLSGRIARRLTETVFEMLNPGGTLLYANFAKNIPDDAYMETFMAWQLIYRNETEFADLSEHLPAACVASRRFYRGKNGNILYAEIVRN